MKQEMQASRRCAGILRKMWKSAALCPLFLAGSVFLAGSLPPALAQTTAAVTVNAASQRAAISPAAFGANTAVWDSRLFDPEVAPLLLRAGVTALRFPGGSTSDEYHWQTQSGGGANPAITFDKFMRLAQAVRAAPIITVNYGSNAAGDGGGDPGEAAAWVDYANNTKHYGIKYWEIGNEIYGNGEYGAKWEKDLHSDHSPAAYGRNVAAFADAMKAKDPAIKVGVVLTSPGDWPDGQKPDWNSAVLAACGTKIDFVVVHWYAEQPGHESDEKLLASSGSLAAKVPALRSLVAQFCGSKAAGMPIFVTETNSVSSNPGKQSVSLVTCLFAADDFMTWLENGVTNVDWWALHNGSAAGSLSTDLYGDAAYGDYGMLSSGSKGEPPAETPFPSYYAFQMLTHLGKSGDQIVSATSSQSLLSVHAVKQGGGKLALLLINKSPAVSYDTRISVSGYTPSAASMVYTYGKSSTVITAVKGRSGRRFTQTAAPYSLTTIVLSPVVPAPKSGQAIRQAHRVEKSVP